MKQIQPEIKEEGDSFGETIEASIDVNNLGYMFDIVSKQIYSNPIESIIREITSNCFDSHVEAEVIKAVEIKLHYDDSSDFISFQDFGVGISPERMKKTYSKWFSSTKRGTNGQIGMFGIGSKSPLSYSNEFFLTTIFENIKYEYLIFRGEKTPKIELINSFECLEENGTTIKIHTDEIFNFIKGCRTQLAYFDNVIFKGTYANQYDSYSSYYLPNKYKILEGEHFKFRPNSEFRYLHICIEKVYYKINFDELSIPVIEVPIALKFNIGDLVITPERENIRYIKFEREGDKGQIEEIDTKTLILEKIEIVKKDLEKRRDEFYKPTSNLKKWINTYEIYNNVQFENKTDNGILLETYDLDFSSFYEEEGENYNLSSIQRDQERELKKVRRKLTYFSKFKNLIEVFNITPKFLLDLFIVTGTLSEAKSFKKTKDLNLLELIEQDQCYLVLLNKEEKLDVPLNKYHYELAKKQDKKLFFIRYRELSYKSIIKQGRKLSNLSRIMLNSQDINYLKFVKTINIIKNQISKNCFNKYKINIDPIWLENYNLNKRINFTKKFVVNHIIGDIKSNWKNSFTKREEFDEYFKNYDYVIFSNSDNLEMLKNINTLFKKTKKIAFIFTAKTNFKYLEDNKFLGINDFLQMKQQELQNISLLLKEDIPNTDFIPTTNSRCDITFTELCPLLFSDYYDKVNELKKEVEKYNLSYINDELKNAILSYKSKDRNKKKLIKAIKIKLNKIKILKYINIQNEDDFNIYQVASELVDIFKQLKIKVSPEWYKMDDLEVYLLEQSIKDLTFWIKDYSNAITLTPHHRRKHSKLNKKEQQLIQLNFYKNYQLKLNN